MLTHMVSTPSYASESPMKIFLNAELNLNLKGHEPLVLAAASCPVWFMKDLAFNAS